MKKPYTITMKPAHHIHKGDILHISHGGNLKIVKVLNVRHSGKLTVVDPGLFVWLRVWFSEKWFDLKMWWLYR